MLYVCMYDATKDWAAVEHHDGTLYSITRRRRGGAGEWGACAPVVMEKDDDALS